MRDGSAAGRVLSACQAADRADEGHNLFSRWYRTGVFYSLDVGLFQDSNDDGTGDFQGLIGRLDYLARLGVTTVWLNPHPPIATPGRRVRRHRLLQHPPTVRQPG